MPEAGQVAQLKDDSGMWNMIGLGVLFVLMEAAAWIRAHAAKLQEKK